MKMNQVIQKPQILKEIEREPETPLIECIYGPHKAEVLHRGTAYCRSCYDQRNRLGQLIN